jgi:hypothetical protein
MVKNLTPHAVTVVLDNGQTIVYPKCENPARVSEILTPAGKTSDGTPAFSRSFGPVTGLPEMEIGTILIVSSMVAQAEQDRIDLFSPVGLVRDENGAVIGCKGIGR